jgi:hypothetical protein
MRAIKFPFQIPGGQHCDNVQAFSSATISEKILHLKAITNGWLSNRESLWEFYIVISNQPQIVPFMKYFYHTRILFAAICFAFALNTANAQAKQKPVRLHGIMLNSCISGNSFGVQRNPSLEIAIGKRLVMGGGPVFNRNFGKNTGSLFNARYYLVRDEDSYNGHFRLAAVATFQRMHNQSLCKDVLELERQMAFNMKNDEVGSFCEMRYKGWEASAGIGLSYRFNFGMTMRAEAALCYYTTYRSTNLPLNAFHDENGTSLRLGCGIGWSFGKKVTPPASAYENSIKVRCLE